MKKVLFLCTGNSCRSIMAEALLNHYGSPYFQAFSAGSHPTGFIHPKSIQTLTNKGINPQSLKKYPSKSWDDLNQENFDILITVCDQAAGETCPIYLNGVIKVHWGVEDPGSFVGTEAQINQKFLEVCERLERKIIALTQLKIDKLTSSELTHKLQELANAF